MEKEWPGAQEEKRTVGLIILGAGGYMGGEAIGALPLLSKELETKNIFLELICLAERKRSLWGNIDKDCEQYKILPLPPKVESIEEVIIFAIGFLRGRHPTCSGPQ